MFTSVSIVNFEHVIAGWGLVLLENVTFLQS